MRGLGGTLPSGEQDRLQISPHRFCKQRSRKISAAHNFLILPLSFGLFCSCFEALLDLYLYLYLYPNEIPMDVTHFWDSMISLDSTIS